MPNIIYGCVVGEWGKDITLTAKDTDGNVQDLKSFAAGTITTRVRSPNGRKIHALASTFVNTGSDGQFAFCFSSDAYADMPGEWECTTKFEVASQVAKTYLYVLYVEPSV